MAASIPKLRVDVFMIRRRCFHRYSAVVLPVVTTDEKGDDHVGSVFYVGEGVFVTVRHVVEDQASCRLHLERYENFALGREIGDTIRYDDFSALRIEPYFHPNPKIDVAAFKIAAFVHRPATPLGGHLDDWIDDIAFVLNEVLVLGYPPIPLSNRPVLVAARGQINAVVDLYNAPHVHFVVSVPPKGRFSGVVVMSEYGFALGVITQSLVKDHAPEELGYLTVLSIEPVLECLEAHKLVETSLSPIDPAIFNKD